jgi:hypothetical protein
VSLHENSGNTRGTFGVVQAVRTVTKIDWGQRISDKLPSRVEWSGCIGAEGVQYIRANSERRIRRIALVFLVRDQAESIPVRDVAPGARLDVHALHVALILISCSSWN